MAVGEQSGSDHCREPEPDGAGNVGHIDQDSVFDGPSTGLDADNFPIGLSHFQFLLF
jgi:hypothetical protein